MNASQLIDQMGEKLIGRKIFTQAMGKYPGGFAEVVELCLQPWDDVLFIVWLPAFGHTGVFSHEEVTLTDHAADADFSRDVDKELNRLRTAKFSTKHDGEEAWKNRVASDLNALVQAACSISGNRTLPATILRTVKRVANFEEIQTA